MRGRVFPIRRSLLAALMLTAILTIAVVLWDLLSPPGAISERPLGLLHDRPAGDREQEYVSSAEPRTPEEEHQGFHLPPGFEIQLFAAEPDIGKPMNMAFDAKGRLWVTQSSEYPFPAPEGQGRDKVTILEDTDRDGRADRFITFADDLNIPIGIAPIKGGAIVYSIPNIYKMLDTDGDGRADRKEILYGTFGYQDTHGMASNFVRGFDGWLYACHGYTNTSVVRGRDGDSITITSGNTFRMKTDGSRVEQFTFGQVNPFGLAFDALGNLYSCDCHSKPIYLLLKGGDYPHFNKLPTGIGFAPPMMVHGHHSTAIAGIAYYAARNFPPPYRDSIFIGNVVTSRVNRDALTDRGSTRIAVEKPDFIVSEDPWFRPVNLQVGPDGALYIADFYNRIIGHYEVPLSHPGRDRHRGRIWRVVYGGPDVEEEALIPRVDWFSAPLEELLKDLGHSNLTVRMLALHEVVDRFGQAAVMPLQEMIRSQRATPFQKTHGLWALKRLDQLDEGTWLRAAADPDRSVRCHVMRILSECERITPVQRESAVAALKDSDSFVQRAAVQALRSHPRLDNLGRLLESRRRLPRTDTHLVHAVRMALRDHLREPDISAAVSQLNWKEDDAKTLAGVMVGVNSPRAARFLFQHIQTHREQEETLVRYVEHAARFLPEEEIDSLVAYARFRKDGDVFHQLELYKAFEEGLRQRGSANGQSPRSWTAAGEEVRPLSLPESARSWAVELIRGLVASGEEKHLESAFGIAASICWRPLESQIVTVLSSKEANTKLRAAAVDAIAAINWREHLPLLGRILRDGTEPSELRLKISGVLGKMKSPAARREIIEAVRSAPRRLQTSFAVALFNDEERIRGLLEAVERGKISPDFLLDSTMAIRIRVFDSPTLNELFARLTRDLEPPDERASKLIQSRLSDFNAAQRSPELGAGVFETHCMNCHQIAGKGKSIGPQLDGIGNRGAERLIEDILDPSRNADQSFRTTVLKLQNDTIVSGLLLREEGAVLLLMDDTQQEVRVHKSDIQERSESPLSPMPADFAEKISAEDFNHLLAYLVAQR